MLKKRIIFTLLFDNGNFMLSRNFRLQNVGDVNWLQENYNFADVSFYIDELIILDVSRGQRNLDQFCEAISRISAGCFAPIAAGGGITTVEHAQKLLRSGADKIVLNSAIWENYSLISELSGVFGQQCIIASIDLKKETCGIYSVHLRNGSKKLLTNTDEAFLWHLNGHVGEIYLNSIDQDGTGQGYDFETLGAIPNGCKLPIILAGGVGNAKHLLTGLLDDRVDAVATAQLFNFVGDGLQKARTYCLKNAAQLAQWPEIDSQDLLIDR